MRKLLILFFRFYQKFLSRLKPVPTCRFSPTCSQYAIDAVTEWGIIAGLGLTIWRVLRCNPFSKGGLDPVPKRKKNRNKSCAPDTLEAGTGGNNTPPNHHESRT